MREKIKPKTTQSEAVAQQQACSPLYLPIETPRGIEYASIPVGMSQEYYDFMLYTLAFHAKHHTTFIVREPKMEQYDENKLEHNDAPPLALSDWQMFDDPSGSESTLIERGIEDRDSENVKVIQPHDKND